MSDSIAERARAHLANGAYEEAATILAAAVETTPTDATLLRLLGTARYMTRALDEAIELFRCSMTIEPDDARTCSNLGAAYLECGRFAEAAESFSRAAELAPEEADAHFNLGLVRQRTGALREAAVHFTRTLELAPTHSDAEMALASVSEALGDYSASLRLSERVLAREPGSRRARLTRSRSLSHVGALDAAGTELQGLRSEFAHDPVVAVAWGHHLSLLGRYEDAEAIFAQVLEQHGDNLAAANGLAGVLYELGRFDEVVTLLQPLREAGSASARLLSQLAVALHHLERKEEARSVFDRALEIEPKDVSILNSYGHTLAKQGLLQQADEVLERAMQLEPELASLIALRAEVKSRQQNHKEALALCERYLDAHPQDRSTLACQSILLHVVGEPDRAKALLDFDRFITQQTPPVPAGYASLEDFNEALCRHVRNHPSLSRAPQSHATRFGLHSGPLRVEPKGPIAILEKVLAAAGRHYMQALRSDPTHPFLSELPGLGMLNCWGVVMRSQAHQSSHIHPAAWLSGVYYAKVPPIVEGDSTAGWIEFGLPPGDFGIETDMPTRCVKPQPGLLVIFPSYFYHRTIAYDADQERISIAFDLMPAPKARGAFTDWQVRSSSAIA